MFFVLFETSFSATIVTLFNCIVYKALLLFESLWGLCWSAAMRQVLLTFYFLHTLHAELLSKQEFLDGPRGGVHGWITIEHNGPLQRLRWGTGVGWYCERWATISGWRRIPTQLPNLLPGFNRQSSSSDMHTYIKVLHIMTHQSGPDKIMTWYLPHLTQVRFAGLRWNGRFAAK